MQSRLPKPLHGWRAFVGEVGIIVRGVLIALGAGQVVEAIHERTELWDLRSALRAELADDRACSMNDIGTCKSGCRKGADGIFRPIPGISRPCKLTDLRD